MTMASDEGGLHEDGSHEGGVHESGMNEGGVLDKDAFIERLRAEGSARYHDHHPFHVAMHEGRLTKDDLARWVQNRYYYQTRIPIKDALIVSRARIPLSGGRGCAESATTTATPPAKAKTKAKNEAKAALRSGSAWPRPWALMPTRSRAAVTFCPESASRAMPTCLWCATAAWWSPWHRR